MFPPHFDEVERATGSRPGKSSLSGPRQWPLGQIAGDTDNGELRRVGVNEAGQAEGRGFEAVALHVDAAHIEAHGESRAEDMAYTGCQVPAVIGVSLSRAGGIAGAEERSLFILVCLLVGKSSVEARAFTEVVVNATAELVRIVGLKAGSAPVVGQRGAVRGGIKVDQRLPDAVDERPARVRRYICRQVVPRDGVARIDAAYLTCAVWIIKLTSKNRPAQPVDASLIAL